MRLYRSNHRKLRLCGALSARFLTDWLCSHGLLTLFTASIFGKTLKRTPRLMKNGVSRGTFARAATSWALGRGRNGSSQRCRVSRLGTRRASWTHSCVVGPCYVEKTVFALNFLQKSRQKRVLACSSPVFLAFGALFLQKVSRETLRVSACGGLPGLEVRFFGRLYTWLCGNCFQGGRRF